MGATSNCYKTDVTLSTLVLLLLRRRDCKFVINSTRTDTLPLIVPLLATYEHFSEVLNRGDKRSTHLAISLPSQVINFLISTKSQITPHPTLSSYGYYGYDATIEAVQSGRYGFPFRTSDYGLNQVKDVIVPSIRTISKPKAKHGGCSSLSMYQGPP